MNFYRGRPLNGNQRSASDLSAAEVEQIHDKVDQDLKQNGVSSDQELMQEIESFNNEDY